jgi:ABC-2 type transport system permease protein
MSKSRLVAVNEYKRLVFTRQFLFTLLVIPALIGLTIGLGVFFENLKIDKSPVGYIDRAGLISKPLPKTMLDQYDNPVGIIPYKSEAAAKKAVKSKQIQAYFVIPPDYLAGGSVGVAYEDRHPKEVAAQFADFIRVNLLKNQDPKISDRALTGSELSVRLLDTGREFSDKTMANQFLPLVGGIIFMVLIVASSAYLTGIISVERENRVLEILTTSLTPKQLIGGKVLGVIGAAFTQFAFWVALGLAVILTGRALGHEWFTEIQVDYSTMLLMFCLLVPAYLFIAGLVAGIGAAISSAESSQQIGGMMVGIISFSIWPVSAVLQNPSSPLAVGMSLFPTTAPMVLPIRTVISSVPIWQIAASLTILVLSASGALWFAGRALRLRLLFSGYRPVFFK